MTRANTGSGDVVAVPPTNNVYTALSGIAALAVILGLVVVFIKAKALFGGLFTSGF